ncbi:MAG: hypothetical protein HZB38_04800 [Planctomycetes bacterium]|nr:hypothetical protein [Planctomycetota bacterium]
MLVPLALIGPPDRRPVLRVWAGFIALTVGGYTLFPPPEPYDWYPASVQPALSFLAGIGLGGLLVVGAEHFSLTDRRRQAVSAVVVAASFGIALLIETPEKHRQRSYVDTVERDRQAAGEWIDRHAPADARVLTGFGNIAYFGRRTTIDASFLNRRGPLLPLEQLIAEHQPEYVAVCPYLSGTPPERFVPPDGYAVATVIDRTRKESGLDFYVVVMQRAIPTTRPSAPTASNSPRA